MDWRREGKGRREWVGVRRRTQWQWHAEGGRGWRAVRLSTKEGDGRGKGAVAERLRMRGGRRKAIRVGGFKIKPFCFYHFIIHM